MNARFIVALHLRYQIEANAKRYEMRYEGDINTATYT